MALWFPQEDGERSGAEPSLRCCLPEVSVLPKNADGERELLGQKRLHPLCDLVGGDLCAIGFSGTPSLA